MYLNVRCILMYIIIYAYNIYHKYIIIIYTDSDVFQIIAKPCWVSLSQVWLVGIKDFPRRGNLCSYLSFGERPCALHLACQKFQPQLPFITKTVPLLVWNDLNLLKPCFHLTSVQDWHRAIFASELNDLWPRITWPLRGVTLWGWSRLTRRYVSIFVFSPGTSVLK